MSYTLNLLIMVTLAAVSRSHPLSASQQPSPGLGHAVAETKPSPPTVQTATAATQTATTPPGVTTARPCPMWIKVLFEHVGFPSECNPSSGLTGPAESVPVAPAAAVAEHPSSAVAAPTLTPTQSPPGSPDPVQPPAVLAIHFKHFSNTKVPTGATNNNMQPPEPTQLVEAAATPTSTLSGLPISKVTDGASNITTNETGAAGNSMVELSTAASVDTTTSAIIAAAPASTAGAPTTQMTNTVQSINTSPAASISSKPTAMNKPNPGNSRYIEHRNCPGKRVHVGTNCRIFNRQACNRLMAFDLSHCVCNFRSRVDLVTCSSKPLPR